MTTPTGSDRLQTLTALFERLQLTNLQLTNTSPIIIQSIIEGIEETSGRTVGRPQSSDAGT